MTLDARVSTLPDGCSLRRAKLEELAAVDAVVDAAYTHDYGPSEHRDPARSAAVRAERYEVLAVVDAAERVIASVTIRRHGGRPLHEEVLDDELDLRLLAVHPDVRRRGIAAAVIGQLAGRARASGYRAIVLKTAPHMTGAQLLYAKLGFERIPERDGLWIDGVKVLDLLSYRLTV